MSRDSGRRLRGLLSLLLLTVFGSAALAAGSAEESAQWLDRMSRAVDKLNYRGTIVHTHHGEAQVSQVVHRFADGIVTERITALNGAGREIIRHGEKVTCIFPDQQLIIVEHQQTFEAESNPVAAQMPKFMVFDKARYEVTMRGPDRVAGRMAEVLTVHPTDGYRYGYRLWVDRVTATLLKTQLMNEQDRVVEEFLFTDISFPESIAEADLQPSANVDSFTRTRPEPVVNKGVGIEDADWQAMDLPPGFVLAAVRSRNSSGSSTPIRQLVYSDGLASVSVFIEEGVEESEYQDGLSQIGAARAYTTTEDGCLITAVGDVPEQTAKMIALSVRRIGNTP